MKEKKLRRKKLIEKKIIFLPLKLIIKHKNKNNKKSRLFYCECRNPTEVAVGLQHPLRPRGGHHGGHAPAATS